MLSRNAIATVNLLFAIKTREWAMEKNEIRVARLRELVDKDGGPAAFAKRTRPEADKPIDAAFVSQILNGHRAFGEKAAENMARRAGLAKGYFDEPLGNSPGSDTPLEQNTPTDDDYALIPQYSAKGGCGPAYHNGHVEIRGGLAFKRDWLARMGAKPENLSVIYAKGDSMAPTIEDGAVILIDHSQVELRDGKVFALARGEEMIVKRLIRDFSGGWIVRSDNPDKVRYGDFPVSDAAVRIIGRVVWRGGSGGL